MSRIRYPVASIAAAAAIAAATVLGLSAASAAPNRLDGASAAANLGDRHVLHEVDVTAYAPNRYGVFYDRDEGWLLPADGRARAIEIQGYERARYVSDIYEWIITATGRVFERTCFSYCRSTRVGSFIDGRSPWAYKATKQMLQGLGVGLFPGALPGEYARDFGAAHRVRAAVPKGITTFDGRRVESFQSMEGYVRTAWVYWRPGTPPPMSVRDARPLSALVDWYIDPATARLVGFKVWGCAADHLLSCKARGAPSATTRIVTFERLDPTRENLARLTGPNAPAGAR
jgi:hypothetical protein